MTIFATLAEVECMYNVTLQDTKLIDGVNTPLKNRYYLFGSRLAVELTTGMGCYVRNSNKKRDVT